MRDQGGTLSQRQLSGRVYLPPRFGIRSPPNSGNHHALLQHPTSIPRRHRPAQDRLRQEPPVSLHFEALLQAIAPFQDGIVIGVECMFCWYWLADRCAEHDIPFVVGHALYMKLIHGVRPRTTGSTPTRVPACSRAATSSCPIPIPKACARHARLLRRRMYLVHKPAELITHRALRSDSLSLD